MFNNGQWTGCDDADDNNEVLAILPIKVGHYTHLSGFHQS